jgi:cell division protein FtsL
MKKIKMTMIYLITILFIGIFIVSAIPVVYADTDGNELKITNQPDKLILRLGDAFANAEFELKLDSGVFPVPVKADKSGVLTMELGGSKTYTLTRIVPTPTVKPTEAITSPPDTNQTGTTIFENTAEPTISENNPDTTESKPDEPKPPDNSVPLLPMILFFIGILCAAAAIIFMRALKRRREYYENDDDEYDDEK